MLLERMGQAPAVRNTPPSSLRRVIYCKTPAQRVRIQGLCFEDRNGFCGMFLIPAVNNARPPSLRRAIFRNTTRRI